MKTERQVRILSMIAEQKVETQDQLMQALLLEGFKVTQTTISRDLDELRVQREQQPDGSRRYTVSSRVTWQRNTKKLQRVFAQCVSGFAAVQNLVVIHTLPGLAGAAAGTIDALGLPSVAGCVAGDDTVFVALHDNAAAEALCKQIKAML